MSFRSCFSFSSSKVDVFIEIPHVSIRVYTTCSLASDKSSCLRYIFFRLFDCVYEALFNGKCVSIHIKYTGSVHRSFVTTYKELFVCFVFFTLRTHHFNVLSSSDSRCTWIDIHALLYRLFPDDENDGTFQ